MIVLDTAHKARTPAELGRALETTPFGATYFHFIDARRRNAEGIDDITVWLNKHGETFAEMATRIATIDPFFSCLETIRRKLIAVLRSEESGGGDE